jgi:hypothetical protein
MNRLLSHRSSTIGANELNFRVRKKQSFSPALCLPPRFNAQIAGLFCAFSSVGGFDQKNNPLLFGVQPPSRMHGQAINPKNL